MLLTPDRIKKRLSVIKDRCFGNLATRLHYYFRPGVTHARSLIGLAVTDAGPDTTFGDFFTARELAIALETQGYQVHYLRKNKGGWYFLDKKYLAVISLLEEFNPSKIRSHAQKPFCIAWARNWFDRWATAPGIQAYDMVLASSEHSVRYLSQSLKRRVELFPIATNPKRFYSPPHSGQFDRDACFTGSYWFQHRELESFINPLRMKNIRFEVFGSNWERSEKFSPFWRGFVDYEQLSSIYQTSKIVLDDANSTTKPFGAVNSRVFDAIAAGALVLTNGRLGASETFQGLLPSYETEDELHQLIDFYLENEDARVSKVLELQKFVLDKHTYQIRAKQLEQWIPEKI